MQIFYYKILPRAKTVKWKREKIQEAETPSKNLH